VRKQSKGKLLSYKSKTKPEKPPNFSVSGRVGILVLVERLIVHEEKALLVFLQYLPGKMLSDSS
jgi:hypothetical protein